MKIIHFFKKSIMNQDVRRDRLITTLCGQQIKAKEFKKNTTRYIIDVTCRQCIAILRSDLKKRLNHGI